MQETRDDNAVVVFSSHEAADAALRALRGAGFDLRKVSVLGPDAVGGDHPVGFFSTGARVRYFGKLGAFWGGVFGILFAPACFWIPGIGPILSGGIVGSVLMGTLEGGAVGAAIGAGGTALAAALTSLGIPKAHAVAYEGALKAGKLLLVITGTEAELARAQTILATVAVEPAPAARTYAEIVDKAIPHYDMFHSVPASPVVSPRDLEARVRAAFAADPRLAALPVDVTVHGTRVWLSGTTLGPGTSAYAEDVAKRVGGVSAVHNDLVVARD